MHGKLLLVLPLAVLACQRGAMAGKGIDSTAAVSNQALLSGPAWTVTEVGGTSTGSSPPTMTFDSTGKVGGTTSCNRYSADFRIAGEGLTFGPAVSTKMACQQPLMDQEFRFLQLLGRVTRFEVTGEGALRLVADDGQAIVARRQ